MRKNLWIAGAIVVVACCALMVGSEKTEAAAGPFIWAPVCPQGPQYCLDVWDPVTCSNGVTYSNACYAARACQFDCEEGYPDS